MGHGVPEERIIFINLVRDSVDSFLYHSDKQQDRLHHPKVLGLSVANFLDCGSLRVGLTKGLTRRRTCRTSISHADEITMLTHTYSIPGLGDFGERR